MVKTFFAYKDSMTARYTEAGKRVSGTWLIIPQMSVIGPQNSSTLFKLQKSSKITKFKEIKTDSIINGLLTGNYIVTISDKNNCSKTDTITVLSSENACLETVSRIIRRRDRIG